MQIKPEQLSKIIIEETIKVLEAESPGFFKKHFTRGYESGKKGMAELAAQKAAARAKKTAEITPSPTQAKPAGGTAWGTQGYQDVEWSPSEPLKMTQTADRPKLGPSIEKTAKEVGIADEELLQKLVARLKGVEVVSDDRSTLAFKQIKDIMMNIGAEDPADPETAGATDEFIGKVVDQGRLHEQVFRVLTGVT